MSNKNTGYSSPEKIYEKQREILNIIIKNDSLREKIINNQNEDVRNAIQIMIPGNWNFTTSICNINDICNTETPYDREVYPSDVIVTSTLQKYEPKKLRFFVWVKWGKDYKYKISLGISRTYRVYAKFESGGKFVESNWVFKVGW